MFDWTLGVLGYLKHEDLVKLLKKLRDTLKKNGFLVIKDNCVAQGEESQFDADDQYYIRTGEQFYDAAHRSGFVVIKDQRSKLKRVVRDLLPIRIFVLSIKWSNCCSLSLDWRRRRVATIDFRFNDSSSNKRRARSEQFRRPTRPSCRAVRQEDRSVEHFGSAVHRGNHEHHRWHIQQGSIEHQRSSRAQVLRWQHWALHRPRERNPTNDRIARTWRHSSTSSRSI